MNSKGRIIKTILSWSRTREKFWKLLRLFLKFCFDLNWQTQTWGP